MPERDDTKEQPDRLLSLQQAARRVGFSDDTIRRAIHEGSLPARKVLGRWRIEPTDLERFCGRGR